MMLPQWFLMALLASFGVMPWLLFVAFRKGVEHGCHLRDAQRAMMAQHIAQHRAMLGDAGALLTQKDDAP